MLDTTETTMQTAKNLDEVIKLARIDGRRVTRRGIFHGFAFHSVRKWDRRYNTFDGGITWAEKLSDALAAAHARVTAKVA